LKPLFSSVLVSALVVGLAACSGTSAPTLPGPVSASSQTRSSMPGNVKPSEIYRQTLNVSEAFAQTTVRPKQGTYLTFTFGTMPVSGLAFSQTLPHNLFLQSVTSTCGGTATASGQTITMTNGTSPCSLVASVYGFSDATYASDVPPGALTSIYMPGYVSNAVDATLLVSGPPLGPIVVN
jgi:hypothetical protein